MYKYKWHEIYRVNDNNIIWTCSSMSFALNWINFYRARKNIWLLLQGAYRIPSTCSLQTTTNHEQTTSEIHPGDEADGNGRNCHPGGWWGGAGRSLVKEEEEAFAPNTTFTSFSFVCSTVSPKAIWWNAMPPHRSDANDDEVAAEGDTAILIPQDSLLFYFIQTQNGNLCRHNHFEFFASTFLIYSTGCQ